MSFERLSYELIERAREDHCAAMETQRELLGAQHWVDPVRALHVVHAVLDQRVRDPRRLRESATASAVLLGRLQMPEALDPKRVPREGWKERLKWLMVEWNDEGGESAYTYGAKWQLAGELLRQPCEEAELAGLCEFDRVADEQLALDLAVPAARLRSVPPTGLSSLQWPDELPFSA